MLAAVLVVLVLLPVTESCMPGYEAERDKLREHLGIEWIPEGLRASAYQDEKTIRHSSDLNCNFTNPASCQWKNMDNKWGFDSLDFYLFEKIDFTEFPALRVGPGPTKVTQGEKMIFTGDKKREERQAIYYSSKIGCQNSTGLLTFTYWVFNSARVEVVLFEDLPTGGYKMVYEKPYVDCGTVHLNTECHAEIPPRETPFRIGIRAYDINTPEGSFVMLDNIMYGASLCKVGLDMGEGFASTPLESMAEGKNVDSATKLDCDEFGHNCRWRTGGEIVKSTWRKSRSALPKDLIHSMTGNDIRPNGNYVYLYIEQNSKMPLDFLRSDPIACQSQTENQFSFRFWKTKGVELEVCAVDQMLNNIECIPVASANSPAPVTISFKRAAKNFMITIKVKSFNKDSDNLVVIDDLSYRATLCSDALSVFDIGEHFLTTPMLSLLLNRNINSAKELSCDFSRRAADCVWGSTESSDGTDTEIASNAWTVGHGPLNTEKLYSLTGLSTAPEGEFAVAKVETGGETLLLSEVVRCVADTVSIEFNMWKTGTASLQVCLVDESSPSLLDCQPATSGPVVVDLPPNDRPFRIALKAEAKDQGMILVDDIKVQGEVCPSVLRQFSSKSFRPTSEIPDPNVCMLLSCSFTRGHPCLYDSSNLANGATHQVIEHTLVTSLDADHPISILESPPFHLNTVSRLHFEFDIEGEVLLFICNDTGKKELESCFRVEKKGGDDYIELLPSDTKVYLIARLDDTKGKGILKVRRLQLTDIADNEAC